MATPPATPPARSARRTDALSRERIVEASIEMLDASGADGLTVRALTARLATGRGAIYHHVAGKEDLLAAAADDVVARALAKAGDEDDPRRAVRAVALGIFDAIDAHPWVGAQLSHEPGQPAVFRIWRTVGTQLRRLGVTGTAQADAGSALVNYVLGAAAQHAAGARRTATPADREAYLETLAAEWARRDPELSPREAAGLLRDHDDRAQFLAGVDIFLAGALSGRPPR